MFSSNIFSQGMGAGRTYANGGMGGSPFASAAGAGNYTATGGGGGIQPAGQRRYNAFLDPEGPVPIGNLIGSLMGAPTRGQAQSQAQGGAMAAVAERMKRMSPQAALRDFYSSPEGHDFYANSQDADFEALNTFVTQQSPVVMSAGQQMATPEGVPIAGSRVPGQEEAFYERLLIEKAQTEDEMKAHFATLALASKFSNATTGSDELNSLNWLVDRNFITEEQKQKKLAGLLIIETVPNAEGKPIGIQLTDVQSRKAEFIPYAAAGQLGFGAPPGTEGVNTLGPDGAPQVPGPVDLQAASEGAPQVAAPLPPGDKPGQDRAPGTGWFGVPDEDFVSPDIVEDAGIVNVLKAGGGGIMGQLLPGLAGLEASQRQTAAKVIRADLQLLLRTDRALKSEIEMLNSLITGDSIWTNDLQYAQQLIDVRQMLEDRAAGAWEDSQNTNLTLDIAKKSQEDFIAAKRAVRHIPPIPLMEAALEELKLRPQGSLARLGADYKGELGAINQGVREALGDGESPTFATAEEANAAIAANPEAFPPGTEISVGGVPKWIP